MAAEPIEAPLRRLDADLPTPTPMRAGDAAADLAAAIDAVIPPGGRALVPTGFAIAVPEGCAGLVLSRSGLALHHGVAVLNAPGLIDPGYRGEIGVILINHGAESFVVQRGQRIAQLLVIEAPALRLPVVERLPDGPDERGADGFGSSGS